MTSLLVLLGLLTGVIASVAGVIRNYQLHDHNLEKVQIEVKKAELEVEELERKLKDGGEDELEWGRGRPGDSRRESRDGGRWL